MANIPVGGGIGGAFATIASMLIILLGLPQLWLFVTGTIALGCGVALALHFIRHKNPGAPWLLKATRK